ncbi:hypothetical protein JHK85_004685 [Glycine max]|nr:hypothetical protein JHK87_004344 [Glycine soja]KAG5063502.1 hypothetical protein JHK85_004685 [Glycine max]KAG5080443.1 hypothetical protein JHK86_004508 [Glycine max]
MNAPHFSSHSNSSQLNPWEKPTIIFLLLATSVQLHTPKSNFSVILHFRCSTQYCYLSKTLHLLAITNMSSQSSTASSTVSSSYQLLPTPSVHSFLLFFYIFLIFIFFTPVV